MSEISSINTSFYPELLEGFAPKTTLPVPAIDTEAQDNTAQYSNNSSDNSLSYTDLSNYYNDVKPEDLSIKAKTKEKLDAVGQKLAIEANAVVMLQKRMKKMY